MDCMRRLACLILIGSLSVMALSPLATAQIEDVVIAITNYDPNQVRPGETLDVTFTLYKPSGIEIEGMLYTWVGYYEGRTFRWYDVPESHENISLGTGEMIENFTLPLNIRDNLPVQTGGDVYLGVGLQVGCSYSLVDVDNDGRIRAYTDNVVITVKDKEFNKRITSVQEFSIGEFSFTYWYVTSAYPNFSFVPSTENAFYVISSGAAEMLEPSTGQPPSDERNWPLIAGIVAAVVVAGVVVVLVRRR